MITKKGYIMIREDYTFTVKELRIYYDSDNHASYTEESYHSSLSIFAGMSKDLVDRLIASWLSYFADEELNQMALMELDALFLQRKMLPSASSYNVVCDDDKDVN